MYKVAVLMSERGISQREILQGLERELEKLMPGMVQVVPFVVGVIDKKKATKLFKRILKKHFDLVFSLGGTPSHAARDVTKGKIDAIPTVFSCVYRPVKAGLIKRLSNSANNMVGVAVDQTDQVLIAQLAALIKPYEKKILLVYQEGQVFGRVSSNFEGLKSYFAEYGRSVELYAVNHSASDIALEEAVKRNDMVIIPEGYLSEEKRNVLAELCERHNIFLRTDVADAAHRGAVLGSEYDNERVIKAKVALAYQILVHKKKPKELHTITLRYTRHLIFSEYHAQRCGAHYTLVIADFFKIAFAYGKPLTNFGELLELFETFSPKTEDTFNEKLAAETRRLQYRLTRAKKKADELMVREQSFLRELTQEAERPRRVAYFVTEMGDVQKAVLTGCREFLAEEYEGRVEFEIISSHGYSEEVAERKAHMILDRGYNAVFTVGNFITKTMQRIARERSVKIPIFFSCVASPTKAGLVASLEGSGNNLTGVTVVNPKHSIYAQILLFLYPDEDVFLVPYRPKMFGGELEREMMEMRQEFSDYGVEMRLFPITGDRLTSELMTAIDGAGVVMIPEGGMTEAEANTIKEYCKEHGTHIWDSNRDLAIEDFIVGVVLDFKRVGRVNGRQFKLHFGEHKKPKDIPIEKLTNTRHFHHSKANANKEGVVFSRNIIFMANRAFDRHERIADFKKIFNTVKQGSDGLHAFHEQALRSLKGLPDNVREVVTDEERGKQPCCIQDERWGAWIDTLLNETFIRQLYLSGSNVLRAALARMKKSDEWTSIRSVQLMKNLDDVVRFEVKMPSNRRSVSFLVPLPSYAKPFLLLDYVMKEVKQVTIIAVACEHGLDDDAQAFLDAMTRYAQSKRMTTYVRMVSTKDEARKVIAKITAQGAGVCMTGPLSRTDIEREVALLCKKKGIMFVGSDHKLRGIAPIVYGMQSDALSTKSIEGYEVERSGKTTIYKLNVNQAYGCYINAEEVLGRGGKVPSEDETLVGARVRFSQKQVKSNE